MMIMISLRSRPSPAPAQPKPTGAGSGSKPSAGFDADSDKLHPASEPNNSPRKDLSQLLEDVAAAAATPKSNASDTASVAAAAAPAEQMPPAPPHGDASLLCTMCGKRAKAAKQKFCSLCRSDVQACQRDAEAHEQGEWFKTLQKQGGADFEDLVFEYVKKQTATRRKYSQRCKFDFLRYKEAVRVKSAFRLGHKAIFMHKSRAIQHWCERLGIDRREASLKWDVEVEKAKHKLMTGPKESPLTIPVKIDDFLVFENAIEHEKSKESEFKQQKYKDETSQMMDEALEGAANTDWHRYGLDMPADSSDLVNSVFGRSARLTAPSASSASALQSSEEQQEPPPKKTKAFDSGTERNAMLTKLTTNLDREIQGLQAMQDEAQAFLQDPDFVAANGDKELANHERQSTSLLNARIRLSLAFLGSYRPGKELPSKEIIDADAKAYEVAYQTEPAELPEIFGSASAVAEPLFLLQQEAKNVTSHAEKKKLENDFKPVINLVAVMKGSLKASLDKVRKFIRDRKATAERQQRVADQTPQTRRCRNKSAVLRKNVKPKRPGLPELLKSRGKLVLSLTLTS